MKKHLTMLIGLPFSGKTSRSDYYRDLGYEIISRDELQKAIIESEEYTKELSRIIQEHHGLPEQEIMKLVSAAVSKMLAEKVRETIRASSAENFLYDGTNILRATRKDILALVGEDLDIRGEYLRTPKEVILERYKESLVSGARDGKYNNLKPEVLEYFIHSLEEPDLVEGFSEIKVIEHGEGTRREIKNEIKLK